MTYTIKITLVLLSFVGHMHLYANSYAVEKGMIVYDIVGGGVLTDETNLSLKGTATLRFKDWGSTLLAEDKGVVLTYGALKSKQHIVSLEKQSNGILHTVDFKNRKIHERKHSTALVLKEKDTQGLKKTGEESIAGLKCDIWQGIGVEKCLYKGIPLKIQSEVLGIVYKKVAREVIFDMKESSESCELPHFPKENFALFTSSVKTNNTKAKCFTEVLTDVAQDIEKNVKKNGTHVEIASKEKRNFLNKIGHKIYVYQKTLLPELLQSLKKTRECLQTGSNPFEANECMNDFSRTRDKLGTSEDDYIILWDAQRKDELLDKIEDKVIYLQSRISCINRSQNIADLSKCMK